MAVNTSRCPGQADLKDGEQDEEMRSQDKNMSCGPDWSYDEGDETGQGEPMSQSPPQSSGRGSEETDSILCDGREEEVCPAPPNEK